MTTETLDALAPYSEVRAKIEELKRENASKSFDYTKPSGIKAAKSHIHALRGRKADIERVRKASKQDALDYGRKVDAALAMSELAFGSEGQDKWQKTNALSLMETVATAIAEGRIPHVAMQF